MYQWIELIVQTAIIALIQALAIGFFLAGAATGSAPAIVGIGSISLVFIVITMWSGIKAVWNSFNRLFNAMGQAAGGVLLSPGSVTSAALTGGTALAAGVGSSALAGMTALNNGATGAQTAGLMLGGFSSLSGAARTLTHLPGVRGTALGEAAEQFTEGAATRQVARHLPLIGRAAGPLVGALLLSDRDPDHAEYDEQGRVLSRPMLLPAVGEALESWTTPHGAARRHASSGADAAEWFEDENGDLVAAFTPAAARRTGTFTPVAPVSTGEQEGSDYAAEMNEEEMERHVSDALGAATGLGSPLGGLIAQDEAGEPNGTSRLDLVAARLEASAEALANAARLQMQVMLGQMKVTGGGDVAGVMGDVIRGIQAERTQNGEPVAGGTDYLTVADRMARSVGVLPLEDGQPPVQNDLGRFGLFADQALRLGLSGEQAETVVREVKDSPEGKLTDETRTALVEQVRTDNNLSYDDARDEVNRLEHHAALLPNEITAVGLAAVPPVTVEPDITVAPQVDVTVEAGEQSSDAAYDDAMRRESALGGSGSVIGGGN